MQHVEVGDLRLLACSSSERDSETPEVPTLKEKGYDIEVTSWKGFHAPSGIPPERIAFLEEAFKKISEDTEYKKLMGDMSGTVKYRNSKDFQEYLEKTNQEYSEILSKLMKINDTDTRDIDETS